MFEQTPNPIYSSIFESIKIGSITLKNRIVMGPICTGLEAQGKFSYLSHFYQQRAFGGASLIIVGGFAFNRIGAFAPFANIFHKHSQIIVHKLITNAIHEKNAYCLFQLMHCGAQAQNFFAMSASNVQNEKGKIVARKMPVFFIKRTIKQYIKTAKLAALAGYDGVEIDAGSNRLLNSFLTPGLNKRTDEYGKTFENRSRIITEIVAGIRKELGKNFVIGCRISLMDFQLEGKDWTETVALTKVLEEAGVDYFSFTLGTRDVQIPTFHGLTPEGVWNSFIDMISDEVTKPVFYGFNLSTPSLVNEVLENNKKAVVELTQTLITDSNWVKKIKILRERTIIGCTKCYQGCNGYYLKKGESISCMMNPLLFDQHALEIKPVDKPKNILVVGAGPAGLTAAIYAARRGHKVTIYEEKPEVGGQILFASKVPGKKDYIHLIELLVRLCERYDVVIETNHKVIAEESDEIRLNFDEVIIATGMNPEFLDIQGMSSNSIFPYPHIFLNHHKPMGKRIAILGNNRISMDCAIYLLSKSIPDIDYDAWLSSWGVGDPRKYRAGIVGVIPKPTVPEKEITLMTNQNDDFSKNFVSTWKNFETRWLRILGIRSFRSVNMDNYENPTLHISFGKLHENKTTISIDNFIIADKLLPDNALAQQFMKAGLSSVVIGAANQKPSYQYIPLIQCLKEGIRIGNEI